MSGGPLVRAPAVAGLFYPSDPEVLTATVDALLGGAERSADDQPPPKALVVPHAGYVWSGEVAASAYRRLRARRATRLVVLVGPAHFVPVPGVAVSEASAFATPLGKVPVDDAARGRALSVPGARADDGAHRREHSLEVQLPFLQRLLGSFTVLPLAVGDVAPEALADLIEAADDGDDTLVLASTDLSHYLRQPEAEDRDARTAKAICAGDIDGIAAGDACGAAVLRGLLAWVRRHGLVIRLLDRRTSADAGGAPERVVGYGAFELLPAAPTTGAPPGR